MRRALEPGKDISFSNRRGLFTWLGSLGCADGPLRVFRGGEASSIDRRVTTAAEEVGSCGAEPECETLGERSGGGCRRAGEDGSRHRQWPETTRKVRCGDVPGETKDIVTTGWVDGRLEAGWTGFG